MKQKKIKKKFIFLKINVYVFIYLRKSNLKIIKKNFLFFFFIFFIFLLFISIKENLNDN
jgi:hypothetical protein